MTNVAKIGIVIENIYGEAQDIEGAFYDGKYYVVQTRPQV
jgi:phosphoenolpyruvate synthase/pyruvate phosphate dikinase